MTKTVDERVVEMKFDNKQFEANTKTTMSTLDKLKESLKFQGASKGLEGIKNSTKDMGMNALAKSVEAVQVKFSALEVIGMTALSNLANKAINAGEKIVSAFTIDPVKSGFQEYETQINAVQTILANTASKGTDLDQINNALDELNKYADMTIYNFTEMTRNIGTFTAAGIDLDTSVSAIQGIANLAAVSGSTSQQASTAMYQLSQALASGTVKLMDWNSVVNAGMGGEVFQNALKETARLHGVAIDEMIKNEGSFRETLKNEWLTSEVLTETLKKFTTSGVNEYLAEHTSLNKEAIEQLRKQALATSNVSTAYKDMASKLAESSDLSKDQIYELLNMSTTAEDAATKVKTFTQLIDTLKEAVQSGWTQTWEILIGDFEQAKTLFTELSDSFGALINRSAESRNKLLQGAMSSNWERLASQIEVVGIATEDFQNALMNTVKESGTVTDKLLLKTAKFGDYLKNGWITSDVVVSTLKKFTDGANGFASATTNMTDKLSEFQAIVNRVIKGEFGNGENRVKALTDAGYEYAKVQGLVNLVMKGGAIDAKALSDAQLSGMGYTKEQIEMLKGLAKQAEQTGTPLNELIQNLEKPTGRELLIDTFRNALKGTYQVIQATGEAWRDAFPPITSKQIYNIIEVIHNLSKRLVMGEDDVDNFKRTLKGLFAIIDIFVTLTGGGLKVGLKILARLIGLTNINVLEFTASIGDLVSNFRDWLFENNRVVKLLKKTGDETLSVAKRSKEMVTAFIALPKVQNNIERFRSVFASSIKDLKGNITIGIEQFKLFVNRVKDMDGITLDDVGRVFKDFKDNVLKNFFNVSGKFQEIKMAIKDFESNIKKYFVSAGKNVDGLGKKILSFVDSVKKAIGGSGIGFGEILTVGMGIGIMVFVKKVGNMLSKIKNPFDALSDIMNEIVDTLGAYQKKLKAEALLKVAIAIAILVGSIALLTMLDQSKLLGAVGILGLLAIGLLGVTAALSAIGKLGASSKGSITLLTIAGAVLILAIALKKMEELDPNKMSSNLIILTSMAVELAAISAILAKVAPQLSKGALLPLFFALSMMMLINVLKKLDTMELKNIDRSLMILGALVIALAFISAACRKVSIGGAVSVIAIAISLSILVSVFEKIGNLDTSKMVDNIKIFITIFGVFAALMIASKFAGKNAAQAGVGILAMSVSLILIIQALKMISGMNEEDLNKSLGVISKVLLVFGAVVALSYFAGKNAIKAGVMLVLMSIAIGILAGVIVLLSHIDPDGLDRALKAIVTLELVFGALIALTHFAKNSADVKGTLIILAVTIGLLAASLGALSMIEPSRLKSATEALSIVIGAFAILVASTSLVKKSVTTLITLTIVVAALAGILYMLSGLPAGSAIGTAKALSLLLLSLSVSLGILSMVKTISPVALIALGVMTLVVGGLALILGVLSSMSDANSILTIANAISKLLLSLSISLGILTLIGLGGPAALIGIGSLMALIVGVGALMVAIGALVTEFPNLNKFLDEGLPVLEKIGYGIGAFFGNMIGGLTDGLPEIGTNLSNFMKNAQPFFSGLSGIDETTINGAKALADMILIITATELVQGISSWLFGTSSISDFGKELVSFGPYIKMFCDSIRGIKGEDVEVAANAGKAIASFAKQIPNSGGWLGNIVGENSLAEFGKELVLFGPYLKTFCESIRGINTEDVEIASNAGKAIASFAKQIPNSGGLAGLLAGNNNLSDFAKELSKFGPELKKYADSVSGLDTSSISNSVNATKSIIELASTLQNSGGLVSLFSGDNTLSGFGNQLVTFGQSLFNYYVIVSQIESGKISSMAIEIQKLTAVLSSMNDIDFGAFNSGFETLAQSSIDDFVKVFTDSSQRIADTATKMLERFTSTARSGQKSVTETFLNIALACVQSLGETYPAFNNIGAYLVQGFANGIRSSAYLAILEAAAMAQAAVDAANKKLDIHSPSRVTYKTGKFFGMGFVNAIRDFAGKARIAGSNIADMANQGLKNAMTKMSNVINSDDVNAITIRPVLDLTNVHAGMDSVKDLLGEKQTIGVRSNMEYVRSMSNNQNGDNTEIVDAIKDLKETLNGQTGDTNIIDGITYDDGSNISTAMKKIVRAVKIERRRNK